MSTIIILLNIGLPCAPSAHQGAELPPRTLFTIEQISSIEEASLLTTSEPEESSMGLIGLAI